MVALVEYLLSCVMWIRDHLVYTLLRRCSYFRKHLALIGFNIISENVPLLTFFTNVLHKDKILDINYIDMENLAFHFP